MLIASEALVQCLSVVRCGRFLMELSVMVRCRIIEDAF